MERIAVIVLHSAVILNNAFLLHGRVIERSPDKLNTTPEPELVNSTTYQRVARETSGILDDGASNEVKRYLKARHVAKSDGKASLLSRMARDSKERHYKEFGPIKSQPPPVVNVLVKKPIPKFFDVDHDNDFQNVIDNVNLKLVDSVGEHEDEDFNISDYEFDVNHDEFIGQAKPLEPRLRKMENLVLEEILNQAEEMTTTVAPPVILNEKVTLTTQKVKQVKREYPVVTYKPNMTRDDDYSDEPSSSTSPKTPEAESSSSSIEYFSDI